MLSKIPFSISLFYLSKLEFSLKSYNNSTPWFNLIRYSMLSDLPRSALSVLLNLFNKLVSFHYIPSDWQCAIINSLPKPENDPFFRVRTNNSLQLGIENGSRIGWNAASKTGTSQIVSCSFRNRRSTIIDLINISSTNQRSFARNNFPSPSWTLQRLMIILDWISYLMCLYALTLHKLWSIFCFGFTLPDLFWVDFMTRIPQSSILNTLLFILYIASFGCTLSEQVKIFCSADDICLYAESKNFLKWKIQIKSINPKYPFFSRCNLSKDLSFLILDN